MWRAAGVVRNSASRVISAATGRPSASDAVVAGLGAAARGHRVDGDAADAEVRGLPGGPVRHRGLDRGLGAAVLGAVGHDVDDRSARAQVVAEDLHGQHRGQQGGVERVVATRRRARPGCRCGDRRPAQRGAGTLTMVSRWWGNVARTSSRLAGVGVVEHDRRRRRVPWPRPRGRRGGRPAMTTVCPASRKPSAIVRPSSVSPPVSSTSISADLLVFYSAERHFRGTCYWTVASRRNSPRRRFWSDHDSRAGRGRLGFLGDAWISDQWRSLVVAVLDRSLVSGIRLRGEWRGPRTARSMWSRSSPPPR